jgi:GT2 family glycosyltransferase
MKVSVAICTHNRAKDTTEAVESVMAANEIQGDFEIIVVDNRSTDDTAAAVKALQERYGSKVRYVYEQELGLSVARNRAIREAKGDYILFLDDDALALPGWMGAIVDVFESDSAIGCVGGRIDPVWESEEPEWIPEEHRSVFTILDFSRTVTEMEAPSIPYGANVAFRRKLFLDLGGFREDLGRKGGKLLSSEESELIARLRRSHKVYYTPHGCVHHKISKERATRKWFLKRMFWQGVSDAVRREDTSVFAVAKHIIRLLQAVVTMLPAVFRPKAFIRQLVHICYRNGSLVGILRYGGRN